MLNHFGPNKLSKHFGFIRQYISERVKQYSRGQLRTEGKNNYYASKLTQTLDSALSYMQGIDDIDTGMILNRISLHQCCICTYPKLETYSLHAQ